MKNTKVAETRVVFKDKTSVDLEFKRFGEKGKPKTKEYFWLSRAGAFTIEDLKEIVNQAEELIKIVDES